MCSLRAAIWPRPAGISPRRATDFLVMRQESKQRHAPSSPPLRGALAPNVVGGRPCELASLRHAGPHNSAANALRSAAHKGLAHRTRCFGGCKVACALCWHHCLKFGCGEFGFVRHSWKALNGSRQTVLFFATGRNLFVSGCVPALTGREFAPAGD